MPYGGALAVGVVLVQGDLGNAVGGGEDGHGAPGDLLSRAVCDDGLASTHDLGGGVLGVGVVDVPAGTVGQHRVADRALGRPGEHLGVVPVRGELGTGQRSVEIDAGHVRVPDLVGQLGGMRGGALQLEAAGVPQRGLVPVVPAHASTALPLLRIEQGVGPDHQVGEEDRAAGAGPGPVLEVGVQDAELGLDAHDALGGQSLLRILHVVLPVVGPVTAGPPRSSRRPRGSGPGAAPPPPPVGASRPGSRRCVPNPRDGRRRACPRSRRTRR